MEDIKKNIKLKLFSDLKRKLKNKEIDELYEIYHNYKETDNLSKVVHLKDILDEYLVNYDKNKIIKLEILKIIKREIDDIEISEKNDSYPDYNNKDFINKINNKVEFNSLVVNDLSKNDCNEMNINFFELSPYQIFLKNFFSKGAPYKSLLVYHGTGVGKTCSGISIAENYTNDNIEIIILASTNIINNWKNTILDTNKNTNQCTANKYIDTYNNELKIKKISKEKIKKNIINKKYKFYGYIEFANMVIKYIKNNVDKTKNYEYEEKRLLSEYFNNKFLIIDEIHNIRTEKEKVSRNILNILRKIVKYNDTMKLLVLSATPMYNSSIEIIFLLNLLLLNDNRPELLENEIFKEGKITQNGLDIINKKCRGYISYVRGNDPNTFPYRLYPTINKTTKKNIISEFPDKNPFNQTIQEKDKIKYLVDKLYGCEFSKYQGDIYESYIKANKGNKKIYDNQLEQISLFTYPLMSKNLNNSFGTNGLKQCFNIVNGIYNYKKEVIQNKKYGYFLQIDKIKNFSTKFHLLLNTIKNSKGIIFIFSRYIDSSIVPLMLALEENGYGKYNNENILNTKGRKINKISYDGYSEDECKKKNIEFKQAKYIVISGSDISKNNKTELDALKDSKNLRGEEIKIIIGSEVTKEGIDMKRIREIHILEPWYHLNRTEQIIGRGIRYCSHKELNKDENNVTIFQYTSFANLNIESSDIYKYRRAELKSKNIQLIENVLQKNAIDCSIFKSINEIDETKLTDETIETSQYISKNKGTFKNQVISNYNPYKKKYFNLLCSEYCNYKCNKTELANKIDISTINKDHVNNIFKLVYKYIAALFKKQLIYKLDNMIEIIRLYINVDKSVLYLCLDKMINEKILIQNENNINGYIIYKNEYYIFQPENYSENIPYFYRNKVLTENKKHINFKIKEKKEKKEKKKDETQTINIKYSFNKIKKKIDTILQNITLNFDWLTDNIKLNYACDRLDFNTKLYLFYYIVTNNKDLESYDTEMIIKNYYRGNLIYKNDGGYVLDSEETRKNPIGFYLSENNKISFYFVENSKLRKCTLFEKNEIEKNIDIDIYKEYLTDIMMLETYGYGFYNEKNDTYDLKIKNPNKSRSRDKLGCRICNSNDFKKTDVKDYIKLLTKETSEYEKLSKFELCNYIEFLLRYNTINEDKIYFINIDNILLADIILD